VIGWFPQLVARISAKVHTKLLFAFLSIVILFVALGAVGLSVLHTSNERAESLIKAQDKIAAYRQLQRNITEQLYTVTMTGHTRQQFVSSTISSTILVVPSFSVARTSKVSRRLRRISLN